MMHQLKCTKSLLSSWWSVSILLLISFHSSKAFKLYTYALALQPLTVNAAHVLYNGSYCCERWFSLYDIVLSSLPLSPFRWHGVLSTGAPSSAMCLVRPPPRRAAMMACQSHAASRTTTSVLSTHVSWQSSRSVPGEGPSWFCQSIMSVSRWHGRIWKWHTHHFTQSADK